MCRIHDCFELEDAEEDALNWFNKLEVARRLYLRTRDLVWQNHIILCTGILAALAPYMLKEIR